MKIQVYGSGCPTCKKLEQNVIMAVEELAIKDAKVEHIYDVEKMMNAGITFSPALVIDGQIIFEGRVPDVSEIKKLLSMRR
ncbi:MAG: thioredoxin family protein [Candidatus Woesearchaeota archaeon]